MLALGRVERVADRVAAEKLGTAVSLSSMWMRTTCRMRSAGVSVASLSMGTVASTKSDMYRLTMAYSTSCLFAKWWYMVDDDRPTASAMSRIDVSP